MICIKRRCDNDTDSDNDVIVIMINVLIGSFCLTHNTVFPICKVKILKTLCVGASVTIGSARVDLCK